MSNITATIVQDSKNSSGNRLTTFILEYPRFVHAEFMTHRMFSKNAASSRAIPIEKMIQHIIDNPAMPEWWGKNQSGMQANEELDDIELRWDVADHKYGQWTDKDGKEYEGFQISNQRKVTTKEYAKFEWLRARDLAVERVRFFNKIGLHKQIANRILEPWFHIRVICSATEYQNFFALRAHKDAQPEIRVLAEKMLEAYNNSTPKSLKAGKWHIPFGDKMEEDKIKLIFDNTPDWKDIGTGRKIDQIKQKIAIARCARVSYFNFEGKDDYEADIKLCDRLFATNPKHLSPTEHVALAVGDEWYGNYRGFKQFRKFFTDENLSDSRVKIS